VVFESTNKAVTYDDKAKLYRVTGILAICRMEARVAVPSIGLSLEKRPVDKRPPAAFTVIGNEVNGKYCRSSRPSGPISALATAGSSHDGRRGVDPTCDRPLSRGRCFNS
jgi:hypothetical protein